MRLRRLPSRPLPLAAVVAALAAPAAALPVTIPAFDNGQYTQTGVHNAVNRAVFAGWYGAANVDYRAALGFDLSAYAGWTATAATIQFAAGNGGFYPFPSVGSETVQFWEVAASSADLFADRPSASSAGAAIFADLGSGLLYGGVSLSSSVGVIAMPAFGFNFATGNGGMGMFAINAALASGGHFNVGAAVSTLARAGGVTEGFWGFSGASPVAASLALELTPPAAVPLPAAGTVLALALAALPATRARRLLGRLLRRLSARLRAADGARRPSPA